MLKIKRNEKKNISSDFNTLGNELHEYLKRGYSPQCNKHVAYINFKLLYFIN